MSSSFEQTVGDRVAEANRGWLDQLFARRGGLVTAANGDAAHTYVVRDVELAVWLRPPAAEIGRAHV